MKNRLYTKVDKENRARDIADVTRVHRESGDGRGVAVSKSGFSERTVYEYAKIFPVLRDELSKFKKDKRFYK